MMIRSTALAGALLAACVYSLACDSNDNQSAEETRAKVSSESGGGGSAQSCMAQCEAVSFGPLDLTQLISWITMLNSNDDLIRAAGQQILTAWFSDWLNANPWWMRYCLLERIAAFFDNFRAVGAEVSGRLDRVLTSLGWVFQSPLNFPQPPFAGIDPRRFSSPFLASGLLSPPPSRGEVVCAMWDVLHDLCNLDGGQGLSDGTIENGFWCFVHATDCTTLNGGLACREGQTTTLITLPWGQITICRGPLPPGPDPQLNLVVPPTTLVR
jgi:hypothetical protein